MVRKSGTKIWMDIYNKPADSKRYCDLRQTTHGNVEQIYRSLL